MYHNKLGGGWSLPPERRLYVEYKLIIYGRLCSLNEYIKAERTNRYKGAKIKRDNERIITASIKQQLRGIKIENPVRMDYLWVVPDKRTDRDNIVFARKFIQDALVDTGVLKDDGWKYVVGFSDRFELDKENPRIEVLIKEI